MSGAPEENVTLFLCGDVMTGRGVDQLFAESCDPRLHERFVKDARRYVELAEAESGPVPAPVEPGYVWGEALEEVERAAPDARIVNLETAVTTSDDHRAGKGIHYRMHPKNVSVLEAAGIDACALANNHVLDWGEAGLRETLETLAAAGIRTAGAGRDREEARAPAALELTDKEAEGDGGDGRAAEPGPVARRLLLVSCAFATSGVSRDWAAAEGRPGVWILPRRGWEAAREVAGRVRKLRRGGEIVVVSVHWGKNWSWRIPAAQREFARVLVEEDGADVVHGHSSHHPKGIEVHRGRPILYGCGDFINDYEGIGGQEEYRGELRLGYFLTLDARTGELERLLMTPFRSRRLTLRRASVDDAVWMADRLDRESGKLGVRVRPGEDGRLEALPG